MKYLVTIVETTSTEVEADSDQAACEQVPEMISLGNQSFPGEMDFQAELLTW